MKKLTAEELNRLVSWDVKNYKNVHKLFKQN